MPAILLTGATGFLGSHLLRAFRGHGHEVVILKRSSSQAGRIADLLGSLPAYDVDRIDLESVFRTHQIDVVVHTATSYGRKGESHASIIQSNVEFPLRLLEAAGTFGTKAFINTDSFSNKGPELVDALAWYMLTKRQFREAGALHAASNPIQFTTARIEHVFGPNDDGAKLVPTLIRAFRTNETRLSLTAGEQSRDFVYVDDVVSAYQALIDAVRAGGTLVTEVEIGRGEAAPLRQIVELIHELCNSRTELGFGALPYRSGELMASVADTSPLRALGWSPRIPVREGLQRTIDAMARQEKTMAGAT